MLSYRVNSVSTVPEIPVWVCGKKKWVTGITKKTTFDDVIYALVRHSNLIIDSNCDGGGGLDSFVIVEVCNSNERVLKGQSKVFKAWRNWNENNAKVTLYLRKIQYENSSTFLKRLLSKKVRRKRNASNSAGGGGTASSSPNLSLSKSNESSSIQKFVNSIIEKDRELLSQQKHIQKLDAQINEAESSLQQYLSDDAAFCSAANSDNLLALFPNVQTNQANAFSKCCDLYMSLSQKFLESYELLLLAETTVHNELKDSVFVGGGTECALQEKFSNDPHLTSLKQDVYKSRELTRLQCKQIHDLELNVRDIDAELCKKRDDLKQLEGCVLYCSNMTDGISSDDEIDNVDNVEQLGLKVSDSCENIHSETHHMVKANFENDADSGINSMSSEEANKRLMETLV